MPTEFVKTQNAFKLLLIKSFCKKSSFELNKLGNKSY